MRRYLIIGFVLCFATMVAARGLTYHVEGRHYFGVYAEGGYTNMHLYDRRVAPLHGYGVGGGVLYEYAWDNYFLDIGCGFLWQQGGYGLTEPMVFEDRLVRDSQGTLYTLHTVMSRSDMLRRGAIDIPVLFGGTIGPLYMLGGVKVGVDMLRYTSLRACVTTYGEYDRYISLISQTSNHGFRSDVPLEQAYESRAAIDVRLSFELGWDMGEIVSTTRTVVRSRIGLFADYGVFAARYDFSRDYVANRTGNYDFSTYRLLPIVELGSSRFLANALVGVKWTFLIGGAYGMQQNCKHCRMMNNYWRKLKYKSGCVTCEYIY